MATPVFCCGAECGVAASAGVVHWSGISGPGSFSTTTFRSGLRSFRCNPSASVGYFSSANLASTTDWVVRAYVRFATLPDATSRIFALSSAVAQGVYFNVSDSKLYVGDSTSNLGATGVAITTGVWYRIDFKATVTTRDQFTDDVLVSQTLTDYPLGAGYVLSYIPNADGTHNVAGANDFERTLTGTDITNATTDAWQLIDERPLPTTAVDFINGIGPPNSTDYVEWQYEDSTAANAPRAVEGLIVYHDASGAGTNNITVTLPEDAGGTSA